MLVERGVVDVVADRDGALDGVEFAEQVLDEGGLPGAVRPDQRDLAATLDDERDVTKHRHTVVAGGHVHELGHDPRRALGLGVGEAGLQLLVRRDLDLIELRQRLQSALDLLGLGRLVAEPFDELFDVRLLAGLLCRGGACLGHRLFTGDDELGEPTDVLGALAVDDLDHPVGDAVDEVAVV